MRWSCTRRAWPLAGAAGDPWARPARGATSVSSPGCSRTWSGRSPSHGGPERVPRAGDVEGTAWSLISLGAVARYRGDATARRPCWGSRSTVASRSGSVRGSPGAKSSSASSRWTRGDQRGRRGAAATELRRAPRAPRPVADGARPRGPGGARRRGRDVAGAPSKRRPARPRAGDPGGDRRCPRAVRARAARPVRRCGQERPRRGRMGSGLAARVAHHRPGHRA